MRSRSAKRLRTLQFHELWVLPVLSQECELGPRLRERANGLDIEYDFPTEDSEEVRWEAIRCLGVAAFMFIEFPHCSEEHAAAYDRLVEVGDSPWLTSLARLPEGINTSGFSSMTSAAITSRQHHSSHPQLVARRVEAQAHARDQRPPRTRFRPLSPARTGSTSLSRSARCIP